MHYYSGISALAPESRYIEALNCIDPPKDTDYYAISVKFSPESLTQLPQHKKDKLLRKLKKNFGDIPNDGIVPTFGGHGLELSKELSAANEIFKQKFKKFHIIEGTPTHHESLLYNEEVHSKICEFLLA